MSIHDLSGDEAMATDKIDVVSDPRIEKCSALLNGRNYGYLLGLPKSGGFVGTIFLIHGWPDISMGWRYQIPMLLELGFRVVAPDSMGYGRSDAPQFTDETASNYTYKTAADDMKALADQLGAKTIILGGHDWGGAIVYRIALWYPSLISHVFAICTPYTPPTQTWVSPEQLVARLPNFTYQLQLASGDIEKGVRTRDEIRAFLNGMFGGKGPNGEHAFVAEEGIKLDVLKSLRRSKLFSEKELEYYADEYARHGMHGPVSWYRTRAANFQDELALPAKTLDLPVLFVCATKDAALKPAMAKNMSKFIGDLTVKDVAAGHWCLWEKPVECTAFIREWLEERVLGKEVGSRL